MFDSIDSTEGGQACIIRHIQRGSISNIILLILLVTAEVCHFINYGFGHHCHKSLRQLPATGPESVGLRPRVTQQHGMSVQGFCIPDYNSVIRNGVMVWQYKQKERY